MSRVIMVAMVAMVAMALFGPACATDPEPLDPTGVWNVLLTYAPGGCGFTGVLGTGITVVRVGSSYAVDEHGATVDGTVACSPEQCRLRFIEAGMLRDDALSLRVDLTVDTADRIAGAGSTMLTHPDGTSCTSTFTVTGTLAR